MDEALLYVDGLLACPEALEYPRFLVVALDVLEEVGRLNESWSVGSVALDRMAEDDPTRVRVEARMSSFATSYALIVSPRDGRSGLDVRHLGPVDDEATQGQLAQVNAGRGVKLDGGMRGYWLYPGSYAIEGASVDLVAGQRFVDPRE